MGARQPAPFIMLLTSSWYGVESTQGSMTTLALRNRDEVNALLTVVGPGENQRTSATLGEGSRPGDRSAEGVGVGLDVDR